MSKKIFLALPAKNDVFRVDTTLCLMRSVAEIMQQGWNWHAQSRQFDHYVDRARNVLLSQFVHSDCTDFVSIDDDIGWRYGDLIKLINQPEDFVCGAYRVKDADLKRYTIRFESNHFIRDHNTGLIDLGSVGACGAGFFRIKRDAILRFLEARVGKDDWFKDNLSGLIATNAYEVKLKPDHTGIEGEDFAFCRKWIEEGGKIWLDPDLHLVHVGVGRFSGCIAEDMLACGQSEPLNGRSAA